MADVHSKAVSGVDSWLWRSHTPASMPGRPGGPAAVEMGRWGLKSRPRRVSVRTGATVRHSSPSRPACLARRCLLHGGLLAVTVFGSGVGHGLDYAYAPYNTGSMDPQTTGWPLTADERAYVLKPEYERRPGAEIMQHKPDLWPVTPAAGCWAGTSWLDVHADLVKAVEAARGPIDVLLIGDSITQQWGSHWARHFPALRTINIGIGGDKTQNVLWRLDHGGVAGLEPKVCVLLVGNNNMFFTPETGVKAAALGVKACLDNLRERFPGARVVVVKIFPAHGPGNRFYEDIRRTNTALDALQLTADPKVMVLDMTAELVVADGTLRPELYTADGIHLAAGGYDVYAARLRPLLAQALEAGR